jgi:hypothetical protein
MGMRLSARVHSFPNTDDMFSVERCGDIQTEIDLG